MIIRIRSVAFVCLFVGFLSSASFAQIYGPEGLNMPGSYAGWSNPPSVNALAGIQKTGGTLLADTHLGKARYSTLIRCDSVAGDIRGGTFAWLFTSGPPGSYFQNKWAGVTVALNTVQTYSYNTGSDNQVTTTQGKFYFVSWQDTGYHPTRAIWMELSAAPVSVTGIAQMPLPGSVTASDPVTVTASLDAAPSPEEHVFLRYSTDGWATSVVEAASVVGTSATAVIPAQAGGTPVSYYVFTSVIASPAGDYDLITLHYDNNNGTNYSYSVGAASYTITASAVNGTITPGGTVMVPAGHDTSFTWTAGPGMSLDSVIVDGTRRWDSAAGFTFRNVSLNHSIRIVFAKKVLVTFAVDMRIQTAKGNFKPDSDNVTVRGTFDDWGNSTGNPDTLRDLLHDSVYRKTVPITAGMPVEFKFWKTDRGGMGWESVPNRAFTTTETDTVLPVLYFDNDAPSYNVTFTVNMKIQIEMGTFHPAAGDVVLLRGAFNGWSTADTMTGPDIDSAYMITKVLPGLKSFEYKYWKSDTSDANGYENAIPNRVVSVGLTDENIFPVWFNDERNAWSVIPVAKGWNMVSLPRAAAVPVKTALYPGAISKAFIYAGSYHAQDTLQPGVGYWVKFPAADLVTIAGRPLQTDTVSLSQGWNMIGGISTAITTGMITTIPAGVIDSRFFAYQSKYVSVDTIIPGSGYWIKATQPALLVMSAGRALPLSSPGNTQQGAAVITVTDAAGRTQVLRIGTSAEVAGAGIHALPPLSPDGGFDIRFGSGGDYESLRGAAEGEFTVVISGAVYPLSIRLIAPPASGSVAVVAGRVVRDLTGAPVTLGSMQGSTLRLRVSNVTGVPAQYDFSQNYPNPFNPATLLAYALPVRSDVSLKVYNLAGQLVETVRSGVEGAGWKTAEWKPSGIASGVYYAVIEARAADNSGSSFRAVRKLLFVK